MDSPPMLRSSSYNPFDIPRGSHSLLVLGQTEGVVPTVEGDELGLEENVTVDAEVALGGLDTAETSYWNPVSIKCEKRKCSSV